MSDQNEEYTLKNIAEIWKSDDCITPNNVPRLTQNTYGKYLIRTDGKFDYPKQKIYVHPTILDNLTKSNRCFWVVKPGVDDYFVHYMLNKYSMKIAEYNPKYSNPKLLFPRPYTCDFDYINGVKLFGMSKIDDKYHYCNLETAKIGKNVEQGYGCEFYPPFWYPAPPRVVKDDPKIVVKIPKAPEKRWKPVPNFLAHATRTVSQRQAELTVVGQPFQHEACSFYNEHYPAAKLSVFKYKFL